MYKQRSLSTAEAVATTAVVCVVCNFTAGLLLGVLLTQCHGHCHRKGKRDQTEMPPVYEDIPLEKTPAIELKTNKAFKNYKFSHKLSFISFFYNFLQKHLHSYHFPRVNMHASSVNTVVHVQNTLCGGQEVRKGLTSYHTSIA